VKSLIFIPSHMYLGQQCACVEHSAIQLLFSFLIASQIYPGHNNNSSDSFRSHLKTLKLIEPNQYLVQ